MSDETRAELYLPHFKDPEVDKEFKKHALALTIELCAAVNKYVSDHVEQAPGAYSIGAACYIASYLIGNGFTDERKAQVAEGLELTLALNKPKSTLDALANLPPQTTPLN